MRKPKVERLDGERGKDRFDGNPWGWTCFVCRNDYLCDDWAQAIYESREHSLDHREVWT